jgi:hypothetical protein
MLLNLKKRRIRSRLMRDRGVTCLKNFYLEDLILSQGKGGRRFERCIDGFEEERKHWRERR